MWELLCLFEVGRGGGVFVCGVFGLFGLFFHICLGIFLCVFSVPFFLVTVAPKVKTQTATGVQRLGGFGWLVCLGLRFFLL